MMTSDAIIESFSLIWLIYYFSACIFSIKKSGKGWKYMLLFILVAIPIYLVLLFIYSLRCLAICETNLLDDISLTSSIISISILPYTIIDYKYSKHTRIIFGLSLFIFLIGVFLP